MQSTWQRPCSLPRVPSRTDLVCATRDGLQGRTAAALGFDVVGL